MEDLTMKAKKMAGEIGKGVHVFIRSPSSIDPHVVISVDWPDDFHYTSSWGVERFSRDKYRILELCTREAIAMKDRRDNPHSFQEWQARIVGRSDAGYDNSNRFSTLDCQCEKCHTQYLVGKKEFPPYKV